MRDYINYASKKKKCAVKDYLLQGITGQNRLSCPAHQRYHQKHLKCRLPVVQPDPLCKQK